MILNRLTPILLCCVLLVLSVASPSAAQTFEEQIDLSPLRRVTVQNDSTLKTLDTLSRQILSDLSGRSSLDGNDAVFTLFDFAYRPGQYADRPFIKLKHLPLREDLADAVGLTAESDFDARHAFLKSAKVAPTFYLDPEVQAALTRIESRELAKAGAVMQFRQQAETTRALLEAGIIPPLRLIPPAPGKESDGKWHGLEELFANPQLLTGYEAEVITDVIMAAQALREAWMAQDVSATNAAAAQLAQSLEAINPQAYPSELKRTGEVIYNRLAKLTLPGAAIYFVALVLLLLSAYGDAPRLRLWGIRALLLGLVVHTAGIAVRWWLVEKSTDDWFHSIPIKNQFESVMFSAWFGAIVGLVLEMGRKRAGGGVFGAAAAFVGFLSLLALFASPYVFGTDIGGDIRQASGILMSYWLYIHVTTVTASYALIGMSFLLSVWWLVARAQGKGSTAAVPSGGASGGFWRTFGRTFFLPVPQPATSAGAFDVPTVEKPKTLLQRLDAANLVILQLAFWLLGAGIIFGAIWADQSWGRPWGWDPKETFALVTWIVYLIILHVRLITPNKALWTAILSVIGFGIMLFNWIGVNFFLVGLHSYA